MPKYKDFLGLGIAGNFALHLAQAGELEEFKEIITADEAAPKGMFPFYLPTYTPNKERDSRVAKNILTTYPLSSHTIKLPNDDVNIQAEPEVGLVCELSYKNGILTKINPTHFGAYNDCSIRVARADKISDKKNWGENSKGFSDTLLCIDTFEDGGIMDEYNICSFLQRDSQITAYGEDVELHGYSYFYHTLTEWMLHQINSQKDFGPLEPLVEYIQDCKYPSQAIISIGATRYTPYGERTFLQKGDVLCIIVYKRTVYSVADITAMIQSEVFSTQDISILVQKVS